MNETTRIIKDQQAAKDACRLFGHMPEPVMKPQGWGEMSNMPSEFVCARCGVEL